MGGQYRLDCGAQSSANINANVFLESKGRIQ